MKNKIIKSFLLLLFAMQVSYSQQMPAISETAEAVPINQIIIEDLQKDVLVFLPKGEFNVKVTEIAKISNTYSFIAKN